MTTRQVERVLGVDVDLITRSQLIHRVTEAVNAGTRIWVGNHNLHSAYLVREDPDMRRWFDRVDLVFVDGMSLVVASRLAGGQLRRAHRATVLDWMPQVLDRLGRSGKVVFHLGGDPSWIEEGARAWRAAHPGLEVHVRHGFFAEEESSEVVADINRTRPDLLMIGMGSPLQERWAQAHIDELDAPVVVIVGAFLGFAAGVVRRPPRWIGQIGLEWLWRLVVDARNVWRRYLIEPVLLLRLLWRDRSR